MIVGKRISLANLAQAGALRLLTLALINSLPVAITSTLFLFFVEDRLQLVGKAGPLLILFFLSAGLSVPFWAKLSNMLGGKRTLLIAMPLSILGFIGAAFLAQGNMIGFAAICIASGVALGADMVVLPTMFSVVLNRAGLNASAAFGFGHLRANWGSRWLLLSFYLCCHTRALCLARRTRRTPWQRLMPLMRSFHAF